MLCVALALVCCASALAGERVISAVVINRQNVFSEQQVRDRLVYRAANAVHSTTREQTILRETGLKPGDVVSDDLEAEIERQLRDLRIFASVSVRLVAVDELWQIHIDTRDQLTLIASASGSFLGGVGEVGFTVGERNLLGTGDSLTLSYSGNTSDETLGAISYRDLHLAGGDLRSQYQFGRTEEGEFGAVLISRPFKRQSQRRSWSFQANNESRDVDYYDAAASVIQVPEERGSLVYQSTWRHGPPQRRISRGFSVSAKQTEYQAARGIDAAEVLVPADNREVFAGFTLGHNRLDSYRKVSNIDTLGYVQDIRLSSSIGLTGGLNYRSDTGADSRLEPFLQIKAASARAIGAHRLAAISTTASVSALPETDDSWSYTVALHGFDFSLAAHTFAARLDLRVADNGDRLPAQFTLGEDNGLRGYPARQFNGQRRVRLNLEDRIGTGWRVGPIDIGAIAFFDAGWIGDPSRSLSLAGSSVGLGLRLGSSPLMGGTVTRIDVAMPLNSIDGERSPQLSIALGQVFGFQP